MYVNMSKYNFRTESQILRPFRDINNKCCPSNIYRMSKKSCPIHIIYSSYKIGQNFFVKQYHAVHSSFCTQLKSILEKSFNVNVTS